LVALAGFRLVADQTIVIFRMFLTIRPSQKSTMVTEWHP
jgi:hypothetical protein